MKEMKLDIKYYELKVKISDELANVKSTIDSLLKKTEDPLKNKQDQEYYETWAEMLKLQYSAQKEAESKLDRKIEQLGMTTQVADLLFQREQRIQDIKNDKKIHLNKELEGLPE